MTALKYIEGSLTGKKYKPDMVFSFRLAIPCVDAGPFAMLINHDGQNDAEVNSLLRLADEGKAPYCVSIGVLPGELPLPNGTQRNMRMNSYDLFDREYGDFLVCELIPHIEQTYGIAFAQSPDMRMVSGGSSGGISAFLIAWFHPDYFHRVYMSSPSFLAMGRGNEIPYLIRKSETKPLRIYEELSEDEPNDYFGASYPVGIEAKMALTFANYDFKYKFFAGEGHCSRCHDEAQAYERNEWLWHGWKDGGVTAPGNSPRIEKVIPAASKWEVCDAFPAAESPACSALQPYYDITVLSNDGALWYCGSAQDDTVYAHINESAPSADKRLLHAMLHTIPRQTIKGAIDMAVDKADRLYVLTEIGIQCVRSFGLIDVILDLPDQSAPQKIAVTDALYVQTAAGIYKRELCADCITESEEKRKQTSYYD